MQIQETIRHFHHQNQIDLQEMTVVHPKDG